MIAANTAEPAFAAWPLYRLAGHISAEHLLPDCIWGGVSPSLQHL